MSEQTTQVENKTGNDAIDISTIEFEHEILMNEEGITEEELPDNILDEIKKFKMLKGRLGKSPTPKLIDSAKTKSVNIADLIHDWLDDDEPAIDEEEENTPPPVQQKKEEKNEPAPPIQETKEALILKAVDSKGNIHYNELVKIYGKGVPLHFREGNLRLDNLMFTDSYIVTKLK
jgi:hypothetical protein